MSVDIPVKITDITEGNSWNTRKTYHSQWHVLVNSNVKTESNQVANEIADCLKQGFARAFQERAKDLFIIEGGEWDSDTVDRMKIKFAAEVGEEQGRVHIHALVTVVHHANFKIDGKAIQVIMREYCDSPWIKNIFVGVKWVPTSKPLEDYIGKNPLSKIR